MKKRITSLFVLFLTVSLCHMAFGQSSNDKDYDLKKANFWKQYQIYKSNLEHNIYSVKPVDPSGLFMVDDKNNMVQKKDAAFVNEQLNPDNAPWKTPQRDLAGGYIWSQATGTYTAISGGTALGTSSNDDNTFAANPIGFTFVYDGVSYTTVDINANGYMKFGTISGSNYPNILSLQTLIVAALNSDLRGNNTTSVLQYLTQGSAPNRTFTIQWSNYGFYSGGWDGSDVSFQIILTETTNTIKVVFGSFATIVTVPYPPQVGINNATTDFNCRTTTTDWSNTSAGGANTSTLTLTTVIKPASGLTWTWAPPPSGVMGYFSSSTSQIQPGVPLNPNTINNQIIKVTVVDTGVTSPISITNFKFETTGSNNPVTDIANAKLYFTGSSSVFATTTQFGSTVTSPNGVFYMSGSASLVANATNYFWLTYDLNAGALTGDSVDAQCDSITGNNGMGTVAPTPSAPFGSNPIDIYCLGTHSTAGCPFGLYIANVNFAGINNTTGCNPNLPYCYTNYTSTTPAVVRQNNPYTISISNQVNPNVTAYGIYVDWNNNGSFADAGEYFAPPVIPANINTPTSTVITVPAGATLGNHRMRIRCTLSTLPGAAGYCSTLSYGEQEDYTVTVIPDTAMTYSSSTTTQTVTSTIFTPQTNAQIIGMQVNVFGTLSPINATSFSLNTTGSTNPVTDITRAKLFYTGSSSVFATTTQLGIQVSPNAPYAITCNQQLQSGTNYFWLTYDVPSTATANDTLDAGCTSITIGGVPRTPTVTAPAGNRVIGGSALCGTYTIPGSYATIAAAIADLNAKGISCPVVFNVAAGYTETAANLTINTTGTSVNTITFRKSGAGANPLITAGVGTGTYDGVIKLNGVSYITFDGIDVQENVANVTTTTQMEWGYALLRLDGTHGCQNNTIKNSNITLNKTNTATYGIYSGIINLAGTSQVITNVSGGNSNNLFQTNNITNSYSGMYVNGYADASPYSFYDQNNTITGNNITNFGGGAVTVYGMYNYYQNNLVINGNTVNGGAGTTLTMYGIYVGLINNANLTISNNTVTLTSAYAAGSLYGIYYGAGSAGTSNNINILNNTVQNCDYTAATSGIFYVMYCNAVSNNLNISGNRVIGNNYGTTAVSTGTVYFIYNLSAAVTSITISNNLDSGNTINGSTAYGVYGIYNGVTTLSSRITNNRVINNQFTGTTAASTSYGIYNSSGTISCVYDSNMVANNTFPTTSAHSFYNMYNTAPAPAMDYSYNTVTGNTSTGSGTFYSLYYSASPGLGSTVNLTNNTITNQSKTTSTGTGSIYGIYHTGSPQGIVNVNNNTVTGFTSAAATLFAGIYQIGSPPNNISINNNRVGNFTNAGISTIYGIYNNNSSTCVVTESQDSVFNITSAGSTIYGMYMALGNVWNVSRNRISGLSSNTSTTAQVFGMYSAISSASTVNIYNNFISDLQTPASTSSPAVGGIYIPSGGATTVLNIYDNTIYLAAVSSSVTTFGSAGIYALTTPVVELKNNVIVNNSTPGPTGGFTVAYQRSSTILTTYTSASNNNCFYAGTPAANKLIYYDGTNSDQTLATFKARVNGRDGASVTELPPFVNVATTPYDLRIQTAVATQLESGGQIISTSSLPPSSINITADAFGTARYPNAGYPVGGFTPTAPDIGAHEFGGLNADQGGPVIFYSPLGIGAVATSRAFNNVVITDAHGVNITPGTKPRCYYKRSLDSNVINDNTNATDGWKYVEANGTTSPFDFTIDYNKLVGGTGVVAGNIIQYFVIAQDLATTPNAGWNQGTFFLNPTTVALVAGNAPISTTLSYTIGAGGTFSGTINVGTAQTYTNLTGATGLFQAINSGIVSGNITIAIVSDLVEDGTNALNATSESGPGGYWIRIVPASGTLKTISGAVANGMIRFNGARRVVVDGNNGFALDNNNKSISLTGDNIQTGPSKYLTFRNTNGANPTFTFINEAGRDSIMNCTIESNNTGTASGTILFSTTTNVVGQGNDSISIFQCDIRDRSDVAGTPSNAIYSSGSTTNLATYNNYNSVVGCNIYNNFTDLGVLTAGIYLATGSSDWTISNNSFYQTVARAVVNASTYAGVYSNTSLQNDIIITNNYFGGSAPNCGGAALNFSGAGLFNYYAIDLIVGGLAASSVQGNTIQNINLTESSASLSTFFRGIFVQTGWINVGNISGNTIGSGTGNNSILLTTNTTASSYTIHMIHHTGFGSIMNNTIGSITFAGNSTGVGDLYGGIYWINSVAGQTLTISNNLIGSLTTPNSIQCTNLNNGGALRGMYIQNGAGTTTNITNNVVANLTSLSPTANALSSVYGIQQNNAVLANNNISGNTVRNLTSNTNYNLGASFTVLGISSPALGQNNFSQNTIYSLNVSSVGTGTTLVGGILAGGASTAALGGTVTQNKIFDLRLSTTGILAPAPLLLGINVQGNCPYTISNNMISITNGDPSDNSQNMHPPDNYKQVVVKNPPVNLNAIPKDLESVHTVVVDGGLAPGLSSDKNFKPNNLTTKNKEENPKKDNANSSNSTAISGVYMTSSSTGACNYYYNTIYIGGTQPGSFNSWAFLRTGLAPVNLRNNLLVNARTGGNCYAIGNEGSNVFQGWSPTASNYNVFISSSAATMGEWGLGNTQALNQWTVSSGGDNQSWTAVTGSFNVANLLTNVTTCDLTIKNTFAEAWIVSGKGIAISGVNTDYTGDARVTTIAGGCTDIGADEFTQTPPSNPAATQVGTISAGATTTYTLYGRTICSVDWGVGGTSYPTALTINYQSGLNPPTGVTTPSRNSNSYWTVVPTGTLQGAKYDITIFFGDNETYNISSPSTNTLLGRFNTFWQVYSPGTGNQQNDVNWSLLSAKVRGLQGFSTYALSDAAFPTPNLLTPADGANNQLASLNLVWNKSAGATTYRVQLATDSLFTTLILNDSTVTDSIRAVSGLTDNTNYWWRVNGKNGLGTGAYTQVFKFHTNFGPPPPALVTLKVIPGGFYNTGTSQLNMRDTIRAYLVDSATCVRLDSNKLVVDSVTFTANLSFANAPTGVYYLFVYHRNHLPIASRFRQTVTRGSTVSYDFTTDSAKAFGFNMMKIAAGIWGMIPGDANQDEFVDGLDQTVWILQNGLDGYLSADFNGDSFVDGLDQTLWVIFNGNSSFLPCSTPSANLIDIKAKTLEKSNNFYMQKIMNEKNKINIQNNFKK